MGSCPFLLLVALLFQCTEAPGAGCIGECITDWSIQTLNQKKPRCWLIISGICCGNEKLTSTITVPSVPTATVLAYPVTVLQTMVIVMAELWPPVPGDFIGVSRSREVERLPQAAHFPNRKFIISTSPGTPPLITFSPTSCPKF